MLALEALFKRGGDQKEKKKKKKLTNLKTYKSSLGKN